MASTDIASVVRALYQGESPAHDLDHVERVVGLARKLASNEGVNLEVVIAAAYLHDIHRELEHTSGQRHPTKSECDALANELMDKARVPVGMRESILDAVHYTERYSFEEGGLGTASREAMIVRDADKLDAMGAIGIARLFTYGAHLKEPIWDPKVPITVIDRGDGSAPSSIHILHQRLARLVDEIQLPSARALAAPRHDRLLKFAEEFETEWLEAMTGSTA